ncbi:unnamed protein product [Cylicocyclus nassatus]|uniref:Peptidase S1 domain-containing protein n=1 Tax=Cylicocyclus nassatus TaxID=53992 RepID=A0AA36M560_CYLNA|nr:unnamed protein product [Cylicocyclus nassatus]
MKSSVCFLIILHFTIGSKYEVYDAQNCGIPQSINSARKSVKVRHKGDKSAKLNEDDNDFMEEKIMGGRRAEKGELPWAVLLRIKATGLCGGTLVSRRHVITAAHCFWNSSSHQEQGNCSEADMYPMGVVLNSTEVFVGGTCSSAGRFGCTSSDIGKVYKVARASYRTYYELGCKGTRDIAILQLTEDVPKTINHVCLPFMHKLREIKDPYLKLRTFGWGRDPLNHFKRRSPFLQIAELGTRLPKSVCSIFDIKGTFCVKSGQQQFCDGDSGGGVTATISGRNYLMGVVSEGPDCDKVAKEGSEEPQVCTDIMYYKKYIQKWIGANGARSGIKPAKSPSTQTIMVNSPARIHSQNENNGKKDGLTREPFCPDLRT